jgi:nicotinate-nucleotide pyrophosphorylase (carboxylating)
MITPTSLLYPDAFLSPLAIDEAVLRALDEDLGRAGDITSLATIPEATKAQAILVARQSGVIAGLPLALATLQKLSPDIEVRAHVRDAARVARGQQVLTISGPARAILTAERTALNFVGRLSGVATLTADYVARTEGTTMRICCTRKTTPGLRALEKYAVRCGGGFNHRFGLDDAMLIKDNHIALAGSVRTAIERAKENAGHLVKIEVEVDTLAQLEQVLALGVDAVLLDNMTVEELKQAVAMTGGRANTEASGRITAATAKAIAATGVDLISAGWITHSSAALDIGLDYLDLKRQAA